MEEFNALVNILNRLLAPDGCPWDREQTLQSMRSSLVEETYEVIEAIDLEKDSLLQEELGDLLFNAVFLCKLAEKEGRFSLQDALRTVSGKLVRRHPHIFGEANVQTSAEVLTQWEQIKQAEKKNQVAKNVFETIPKDLPTLARAQKMSKIFTKKSFAPKPLLPEASAEEKAGQLLWENVQLLQNEKIEAEQALRKRLAQLEEEFKFEQA